VTERQAVALASPCYRAIETMDDKFRLLHRPWHSIVTVNK
jgi:hypothetical protein